MNQVNQSGQQPRGAPLVDIQQSGAPSPPQQSIPVGKCVFDCGPPRPLSQLTNSATQSHPRWMCNPCNNARKAIEAQARQDTQAKKNLKALKDTNPEEWKAIVRASRIVSAEDQPGAPGVKDRVARSTLILSLKKRITQETALTEKGTLGWMDRDAYAAYLKNVRGKSGINLDDDTQKDAIFKEQVDNPNIQKRPHPEHGTQIRVDLGDTVEGSRKRASSITVEKLTSAADSSSLQDAFRELANHGATRTPFAGEEFGPAGRSFNPALSAGYQSGVDNQLFGDSPAKAHQPPAAMLVTDAEWAPFGTEGKIQEVEEKTGKRGKGAPSSGSKKERALGNKLGIFGKVLDTHIEAKGIWNNVKKLYGSAKTNPPKMYSTLKEKPSKPPIELDNEIGQRMGRSAQEFGELYEGIQKTATEGSLKWTAKNCEANLASLDGLAKRLADILASYNQDAEDIQNFCREKRRELASARLQVIRNEGRIGKPYMAGGSPGNVVKWLIRKKGLGLVTQMAAGEVEGDDADTEVKVEDNLAFNEGVKVNPVVIDLENPCVWTPDTTCELGTTLMHLSSSMGKRLAQPALDTFFRRSPPTSSRTPRVVDPMCHLRLEGKGEPHDTLEQLKWAPSDWKAEGIIPEPLRDHQAPWILGGHPGSTRFLTNAWPTPGHGQFLSAIQGGCVVMAIPYSVIQEKGVELDIASTWLCNEVRGPVFDDILDNHGKASTLAADSVMWVPFGWMVHPRNLFEGQPCFDDTHGCLEVGEPAPGHPELCQVLGDHPRAEDNRDLEEDQGHLCEVL